MSSLIYDLLSASVLALFAAVSVSSLWFAHLIGMPLYLTAVAASCFFLLALKLKTRGRIALAGISLAVIIGVIVSMGRSTGLALVQEYLWVIWVLLGSACCVIFEQMAKRVRKLFLIPVIAGIAVLAGALFTGTAIEKIPVIIILLSIVCFLTELINTGWKREGNTDPESRMVFLIPFFALLCLLMCQTKAPAEPYNWEFARTAFRTVRSGYERIMQSMNLKKSWDDEDGSSGFSEDQWFYGNVSSSSYDVFRITTTLPKGTRVYLSGRTFDTFDGRSWTKKDSSSENERIYDLLETVAAITAYDPDNVRNYIRVSGLEIDGRGIWTSHAFLPEKSIPVIRNRETVQRGGDLFFTTRKHQNYRTDFFRLNRAYEGFEALAESGRSLKEEDLKNAWALFGGMDLTGCTMEGYAAYRKRIRELYGTPVELSDAMAKLLDETLAGAGSDYEKLLRIEALLSSMTYTKHPGDLPLDVDTPAEFLDYLILEKQEGYCTHYATAFVLLARSIGIPARCEQGYCFTVKGSITDVSSNQAHAWPEAYIEGLGWLSFEPTPGHKVNSGWTVSEESEPDEPGWSGSYEYYAEHYGMEGSRSEPSEHTDPSETIRKIKGKLHIPALLAVLFLVLYIPAEILLRRYRYRKMEAREKVISLFQRSLRILKYLGFKPEEGETLSELKVRISNTIPKDILSFVDVYEEILYKEREVNEADIQLFEEGCRKLLKLWIQSLGKRKRKESA